MQIRKYSQGRILISGLITCECFCLSTSKYSFGFCESSGAVKYFL